jgi:hypothetical protein
VDRSVVIKGREYKSPYDWCQLNNHQGAIGVFMRGGCEIINIPRSWVAIVRNNRCEEVVYAETNGKEWEEVRDG